MAVLLLWVATTPASRGAEFKDLFAEREVLSTNNGTLNGDNTTATREPGEPQHANKPGGRSLWISWIAPTNGVATFRTTSSSFDTLLAAYYFKRTNDTTLDKLEEAASNDDDELAAPASLIRFGAEAGVRYEIAVDGYNGALGDVVLEWDFEPIDTVAPVVLNAPKDRALRLGDPLTLAVSIQTSPDIRLQWRYNGNSFGAEGPTLFIPSLQITNVGRYSVRVRIFTGGDEIRFETAPVEIQVNSDGQTNALARDKLFDALGSPLLPDDDGGGGGGGFRAAGAASFSAASAGVSRGYNGTQIFNTIYATADPGEPQHCGLVGTASYWYAYTPPADGTLMLDTIGSTFDTYLAVYTYNAPFTRYADLIPLNCDNNSAGSNGAARLEFAAPRSRQFLVVVDGINGGRGIVHLNYQLDTNRLPMSPMLMEVPAPRNAAAGADVTLQPAVMGSAPLHFTWRKGTDILAGATNSALELADVAPAYSGDYRVTVSSHVGAPLDVVLPLRVLVPPIMGAFVKKEGLVTFSFNAEAGQTYFVEHADALGGPWLSWTNSILGDGSAVVLTNLDSRPSSFFRLHVE